MRGPWLHLKAGLTCGTIGSRGRHTINVGPDGSEPTSGGECDNDLVTIPERNAETALDSEKAQVHNNQISFAYTRRIIRADEKANERYPNIWVATNS
jgi:hypothetical protein